MRITSPLSLDSSAASYEQKSFIHNPITALSQIGKEAIVPYLITRLTLLLVGLLATFYILPLQSNLPILPSHAVQIHFPQALWLMWERFDSGFYLDLASNGYWSASTLHTASNWAFYPLYPLLMHVIGLLFGGTFNSFRLAGLLISNISALAAVVYLYLLIHKDFNHRVASRTVFYLALFPMSFYLSAIYSESLFLMLAVASLYYARKQSWWLAGLCGGLAALTHAQGVLLLLPVAWEYLRVTSNSYAPLPTPLPKPLIARARTWLRYWLSGLLLAAHDLRNWVAGSALLLIPAGLFAFMLYAKYKTGDLLATTHTEQWGWGRQLSYPWRLLIYFLRHPILGEPLNWNFWVFNIVLAIVFLGCIVWAFRRLPAIYALYTLVMVILPLSSSQLDAIGRYYLLVFPVFLLLALWTDSKNQSAHAFVIAICASLQALLMVFFILGLPAIA